MSEKPPMMTGNAPVAPAALLQQAEKQRFWSVAGRVCVGGAIVVSLVIVWWSLRDLDRAQAERSKSEEQLAELTRSIDVMAGKWSPAETNRIVLRVEGIEETLVTGEGALNTWLDDLKTQVKDLGYKPEVTFQEATALKVGSIEAPILPTTVRMTALPAASGASPYQRLLRFHRHLLTQPKRTDIIELTVSGQSNSVSQAAAVFNVWGRPSSPVPPTGP